MPDSETGMKPTAFVRESTGLVKNISFFDSIAMNLNNMSVGALLGVIGISGLVPAVFAGESIAGVNPMLLSAIAFVITFPQIAVTRGQEETTSSSPGTWVAFRSSHRNDYRAGDYFINHRLTEPEQTEHEQV